MAKPYSQQVMSFLWCTESRNPTQTGPKAGNESKHHSFSFYLASDEHIEAEAKWPPLSRRHFQMNCLNGNTLILINMSLKLVPKDICVTRPQVVKRTCITSDLCFVSHYVISSHCIICMCNPNVLIFPVRLFCAGQDPYVQQSYYLRIFILN